MINVQVAVSSAKRYVESLYDRADLHDLRLEEVELSEDEKYWFVTLGFTLPELTDKPIDRFLKNDYKREYKIIKIRSDNGEALSMKIRNVEN